MMRSHIRLSLYLSEPVFSEGQVSAVESLIAEHLPDWGEEYRLSEDDPRYGSVKKKSGQSLLDALKSHFPVKSGQGSAVLTGNRDDVLVFLDTSKSTLPPELNSIGVEIVGVSKIGTKSVPAWAEGFFLAAVERLSVRYGCVYDKSEFEAKNMIRSSSGVSAVGVRLGAAIPGLYWLNFFGEPYLDMIGSDRFLSLPAGSMTSIPRGGIVVKLADTPEAWRTSEYKVVERQIIKHLGTQYFFDPADPDQATKAPDFKKSSG
jgi:hypothetical protein